MLQKGEVTTKDSPPVLVVEDDPSIRDMVATVIEMELGVRVREAEDGAEALQILRGETPSLVITDVRMPNVDGVELVRRLRTRSNTRSLPVLVVTAAVDAPDEAIEAGADDYLLKPFDLDALLAKVGAYLRRH